MVKFDLDITGQPELIHSFINDAIFKIEQIVSISDKLRHRIKLILIELLTNSIKHSLISKGKIIVSVEQKSIKITLINKGTSFLSAIGKQLDICNIGEVIEVFFSETNNHHIKIIDKNKLEFLNPYEHNFRTEELKDHYGLHIITLASNCFLYEYDIENRENIFIVLFEI